MALSGNINIAPIAGELIACDGVMTALDRQNSAALTVVRWTMYTVLQNESIYMF